MATNSETKISIPVVVESSWDCERNGIYLGRKDFRILFRDKDLTDDLYVIISHFTRPEKNFKAKILDIIKSKRSKISTEDCIDIYCDTDTDVVYITPA